MATKDLFSDELLAEILYYFSFAVLLQWKSVSKQYLRVISSPYFISSHPAYRQSPHHVFETDKSFLLFQFRSDSNSEKIRVLSLDSNKTHTLRGSDFLPHFLYKKFDSVEVRATQHDLVLCSTRRQDYTHYFVCNPFTKQYVALPPIRKSREHEMARVGFIYDRSQSRFAVAHIPIKYFESVNNFKVHLFLSHTGEWGAFTVTTPPDRMNLMRETFDRKIHVSNGKFVWLMKQYGIIVCDPFDAGDSMCRIKPTRNPSTDYEERKEWDVYHGVCNGLVKICVFSKTRIESEVHVLNLNPGLWTGYQKHYFKGGGVGMNMTLLALHPQNESMIYFHSKRDIFLCDYGKQTMQSVYTAATDEEDISVADNVLSLVLPKWPTVIPALKPAKLQD